MQFLAYNQSNTTELDIMYHGIIEITHVFSEFLIEHTPKLHLNS